MTATQVSEMFTQAPAKTVDAFSLCADANQKILRELVDLAASTAKEGVRLYAELQSSTVEALKDGQAYVMRCQAEIAEASKDPFAYYQKGLLESVEGAQKAFRLVEGSAQAITRSAERLQLTAEQTGKEIQATFAQLTSKVKSFYSPLA